MNAKTQAEVCLSKSNISTGWVIKFPFTIELSEKSTVMTFKNMQHLKVIAKASKF